MTDIASLLDGALDAYADLAELGEAVDDEWSYIQDLGAAWRARLDEVRAARGDEPATPAMIAAVDAAADEIRLVDDPHRAIDWLSTFPQAVLLALGADPWDTAA